MSYNSRNGNPQAILRQIRQQKPPQTVDEVRDRLNLVQRLVAAIDPSTEYEQAITEALLELNRLMGMVAPGDTDQVAGVSVLELPSDTVSLLQQANIRLEEVVQGTVETQQLPVGLTGVATNEISNGETGVGLFTFSGGRYAAEVTADEEIDQFDNIRVKRSEDNLVTPISAEQEVAEIEAPKNRRQLYDQARNAGDNLLSKSVRPRTQGSTLRVTVTLDTTTLFTLRTIPDDDDVADFNQDFYQGADLDSESMFEFQFDADPDAQYNFRCPNDAVTVRNLRVQEILVV